MITEAEIIKYKQDLSKMEHLQDDIKKKMYCLEILTEATEKINEKWRRKDLNIPLLNVFNPACQARQAFSPG